MSGRYHCVTPPCLPGGPYQIPFSPLPPSSATHSVLGHESQCSSLTDCDKEVESSIAHEHEVRVQHRFLIHVSDEIHLSVVFNSSIPSQTLRSRCITRTLVFSPRHRSRWAMDPFCSIFGLATTTPTIYTNPNWSQQWWFNIWLYGQTIEVGAIRTQ